MHSRPLTLPMPVMIPAAAMLSSYMPCAASCDSSRNGLPGSISRRTRSRGASFPREACRARAASPPPSSIAATFSRKSATSAAIAARFCANVGSRVESFVSKTTGALFLERCETGGQQHEQSADRPSDPTRPPRAVTQSATGAARKPCDRQINEQTVEIEQASKQHERECLRRRVDSDELRHERQEKQRHLRIEHVDDEGLAEDFQRGSGQQHATRRIGAPLPRALHDQSDPGVEQIQSAAPLDDLECSGGRCEQRGKSCCRGDRVHDATRCDAEGGRGTIAKT